MRSWSVVHTFRTFQRSQSIAALVSRRNIFNGSNGNSNGREGGSNNNNNNNFVKFGTAAAVATAAALYAADNNKMSLLAETSAEAEVVAKENRVRAFSTPDKIFNYFASYQFITKAGKKIMMMAPLEFYSAITPDCKLVHGVGAGVHVQVTEEELAAGQAAVAKSPIKGSVLNEISEAGLLSYADFCFLHSLLSTPRRYVDTAFNIFDVTGDGEIEAKEFAFVSTKMAHKSGGFGSYTDTDQEEILASSSGLLNYLFGKNRDKSLNRANFKKLQTDLLEEIIQLEFMEYDTGNTGRISEADFVNFLLKNGKMTPKKKAALRKKIESIWPSKGRGISFPSFKSFFFVLANSQELERALFFLDVEGIGVDVEEFRKIASWVSQMETSDHVVKVIFALLDDDEDGRLYRDDVANVLLEWRQSRSYDKGALGVSLGQIRI